MGSQENRTKLGKLRLTDWALHHGQTRPIPNTKLLLSYLDSTPSKLLASHTSTEPNQPARPTSPTHREWIHTENREI